MATYTLELAAYIERLKEETHAARYKLLYIVDYSVRDESSSQSQLQVPHQLATTERSLFSKKG